MLHFSQISKWIVKDIEVSFQTLSLVSLDIKHLPPPLLFYYIEKNKTVTKLLYFIKV